MQIANPSPRASQAPRPTTAPIPGGAAWPSKDWSTWTPTADVAMLRNPFDFMQAAPHTPNPQAVAQADFAFGGNYMAHGNLDVFAGANVGHFGDALSAFAAAQSLKGVHGIVGVFSSGATFDVRELLVAGGGRRSPWDDVRSMNDPNRVDMRPRPSKLQQLSDVGERHGEWGHGDFRSLSALRFVDPTLLGFVRGADQVTR